MRGLQAGVGVGGLEKRIAGRMGLVWLSGGQPKNRSRNGRKCLQSGSPVIRPDQVEQHT